MFVYIFLYVNVYIYIWYIYYIHNINLTANHIYYIQSSEEGNVLVVDHQGKLISTIVTTGAEISGLAINENILYITENSNGTVFRVDI